MLDTVMLSEVSRLRRENERLERERDEALDALHRLRDELLASRLTSECDRVSITELH